MSTIPSLALLPSGYKASKVYSVLPTNGDGDFTFSRTGNATRVNKDGLIETVGSNLPRLDYSDSNCPSLLLEPQRTILILFSEAFTGTNWSPGNTIITQNDSIAPSGEQTAVKLQRTSTSASYRIHTIGKSASAITYTTSVFIKKGSDNYFAMRAQGSYPQLLNIRFRFDTEEIYYANAVSAFVLLDYGVEKHSNGWYRIYFTYTTDTNTALYISFSPRSTDGNIDASDTSNSSYAYVWGAQTEEGSYKTSYIPTEGSTVTRNKDVCIDAGNTDLFNDNEGVVFLDVKITENSSEVKQTSLNNGTVNEAVKILQLNATTFRFEVTMSSGTNFSKDIIINPYQRNKLALQYKANDYKVFVNGIKQSVTQRSTLPLGLDRFNFNRAYSTSDDFTGKVNQLRIYNQALTDTELQQLTTL